MNASQDVEEARGELHIVEDTPGQAEEGAVGGVAAGHAGEGFDLRKGGREDRNERTNAETNKRTIERTKDEWMDDRNEGTKDGLNEGWKGGRVEGWKERRNGRS